MTESPDGADRLARLEAVTAELEQALAELRAEREAEEARLRPPATARERAHRRWGIAALLPLGMATAWRHVREHPGATAAAAGAMATAAGVALIATEPWEPDRPPRPPAAIATITRTPPPVTVSRTVTATPSVTEPAVPLSTDTSPLPQGSAEESPPAGRPDPPRSPRPRPSPSPTLPTLDPDTQPEPGPGRLLCIRVEPLLRLCL